MYPLVLQGAQNYKGYSILLNLLLWAQTFLYQKIQFSQPWVQCLALEPYLNKYFLWNLRLLLLRLGPWWACLCCFFLARNWSFFLEVWIFSTILKGIDVKKVLNWLAIIKSSFMVWLFMFKEVCFDFLEFFMFMRFLMFFHIFLSFFFIFKVELEIVSFTLTLQQNFFMSWIWYGIHSFSFGQ